MENPKEQRKKNVRNNLKKNFEVMIGNQLNSHLTITNDHLD